MKVSRRAVVAGVMAAPAVGWAAAPYSFQGLQARAREMAGKAFRAPIEPPGLEGLDFDALGRIQYRADAAIWRDLPGDSAVEFFHLGRYARQPVVISVVENDVARKVIYDAKLFDGPAVPNLGFAGFRVMNRDKPGDWIAYLGASYFRSAAPFNQYGLSARGLAVDTASSGPEEFPVFTAFWLNHDGAGNLIVDALLDGSSVTGAYRIVHRKSAGQLTQDIEAHLFFRKPVERLGLAPLTSMFWYGADDRAKVLDWRPQIHDSDGLAVLTGAGERLWRPLTNPPRVLTNAFSDRNPRGFGLMQRDRTFADYQDDGAFYDRRPSAWVEPLPSLGDVWAEGAVTLVEIPTAGETDDNIVAFWTPVARPHAGEALPLRYRLHWGNEEPSPAGVAQVIATRTGAGGRPGQAPQGASRKFVVDFAGGRLSSLARADKVEGVVTTAEGRTLPSTAYPVVGTGAWRLMFDAPLARGNSIDLRAFLRLDGQSLTETWVNQAFG